MNEAKLGCDAPSTQKEINSVISSALSRVMGLERYDKDLSEIAQRILKIGMNINDQEHPGSIPRDGSIKPQETSNSDMVDRRPPAMLGRIFDIGEKSEEISISFNKQLRAIRESLDYIERFI